MFMGPDGETPQRVGMNQAPPAAEEDALAGVPASGTQGPMCFHPDADLFDDERKNEVEKRITATFEQYRDCDERAQMEETWRKVFDHYFATRTTNSLFEYQIREVYRQAQTSIANVIDVLLGGDEVFNYKARQPGFEDDAEGATAIVNDMLERFGSISEIEACVENSIIYGTGYTLEGWRKYRRTQYKPQSMHGDGAEPVWERKTNEVIENAATIESIPPWCVYSHPGIQDIRNSPMAFIYRGCSAGDLKTLIREGYIDAAATQEAVENSGARIESRSPVRGRVRGWDDSSFLDTDDTTHEILYVWDYSGWHYVLVNGKIVRAMPIEGDGQYPIRSWPNDQHAEIHWGNPDPLLILEEQKLLNEVMSMKMKSVWLALPRFKIRQGLKQRYDDQTLKPGGRIVVDDMDDIHLIETNGAVPELENVAESLLQRMQASTGSTQELAGTGSSQKTATGLVRLQDAASKRFKQKIRRLIIPLKGCLRGLYDLCARNADQEYDFRIAGPDGGKVWKHYTPESFAPNVDVEVEVGSGAGPEQATQMIEVLKLAATNPLIQQQELFTELFKALGLKHTKRFFASSPNQQGNALKESEGLMITGIIGDPLPSDDHQTHLTIHGMILQQAGQALPPEWTQRMMNHMAIHQAYLNQMMAAQGIPAQGQPGQGGPPQAGGPPPGATPTGQEANGRANGRFNMGARGAGQQAPMPGVAA